MDSLRIVPLTTGRVRVHDDMHRGRGPGLVRRARILRKGPMGELLPIHAWLIEHPQEGRILVDTGETHAAHDASFAEFHVAREDELDHQLRAVAGIEPTDVDRVVLTHIHGDHVDGLPHVAHAPVFASAREITVSASLAARATRALTKQPLPEPFAPQPLALDGPAVGAFPASTSLTADGRVIAVPAPGHTPGHLAVLVIQPDHHVLLIGDAAYDVAQLQDLQVDGVSPKASVAKDTMSRILRHADGHPTVVLPSHDPDGARRLAATDVLRRRQVHAD
ncbi:MBL fold metallo-hydrolase [Baekduia sp. Peel2402]|uniref:MBL fold metallo-hydrolase n=1 Tax=Baekduia sp. Peel2402 TaxID=3458296 RepID=UPI00403EA162